MTWSVSLSSAASWYVGKASTSASGSHWASSMMRHAVALDTRSWRVALRTDHFNWCCEASFLLRSPRCDFNNFSNCNIGYARIERRGSRPIFSLTNIVDPPIKPHSNKTMTTYLLHPINHSSPTTASPQTENSRKNQQDEWVPHGYASRTCNEGECGRCYDEHYGQHEDVIIQMATWIMLANQAT